MFKKRSGVKTAIDSLISASTRIEGDITFQGGLRIDGHVRGDVVAGEGSAGLLVIGEHGRVEGDVVVSDLIVNGSIQGTVTVGGMVEIQPKARVSGELRYRAVEIHHGALVEGILSHFDGDLVRPELKVGASREGQTSPPRLIKQRTPQ